MINDANGAPAGTNAGCRASETKRPLNQAAAGLTAQLSEATVCPQEEAFYRGCHWSSPRHPVPTWVRPPENVDVDNKGDRPRLTNDDPPSVACAANSRRANLQPLAPQSRVT